MEPIRVYVYSFAVSTLDFVDKEGAQHACAQAGSSAFAGLPHYSGMLGQRYLGEKDRAAVAAVEGFCKGRNLEYEVVDVATAGYLGKLRYWLRGLRSFPAVALWGTFVQGVLTDEVLEQLVTRRVRTRR